jgi:hypothetical protein
MGFYYISLVSIIPLAIVYAVFGLVFWGLVRATRGKPWRKPILIVAAIGFLLLPVSEELWIAWSFGQTCKEAGTFIYKKVQAEGFYDDTRTTHAGTPTPQAVKSFEESGYRFLEMKGREKFVRIEKTDGQWRAFALDQPTARYHYKSRDHIPQTHKVVKHESLVIDNEGQQTLGLELAFGRYAPWFFVGLDAPVKLCYGQRDVKGSLYVNVLYPKPEAGASK